MGGEEWEEVRVRRECQWGDGKAKGGRRPGLYRATLVGYAYARIRQ